MAKGKYQEWLTPESLLKLEAWARNGLTDEQIAKNMGITAKTLYEWKKQYCNICESLKKGKEVVDIQVENALLKRAIGYEYDEVTYEYGAETKRVTKQVAPDVTAQIFWLKNRQPKRWRDVKSTEVTGKNGGAVQVEQIPTIDLSSLSKDELVELTRKAFNDHEKNRD